MMGKIGKTEEKLDTVTKLGIFSSFLLITVFSVYFYSPVIKSHALGTGENINGPVSKVGLNLESYLNLTTDKEELNLAGTVGDFTSGSVTIQVSTNALLGYSVSIEDTDDNTDLVHSSAGVADKFTSTFSGTKTSSTMEDDNWGFSLNNTDYYPIPAFGIPVQIAKTNAPSPEEPGYNTSQIAFGAKIGDDTTAGVYSDTVLFTAYANGPDDIVVKSDGTQTMLYAPGTTDIPKMKDFTCSDLEVGESTRLVDIRDSNAYSVKRLSDGNCWMTQNLRLTNKTLTPADSNVSSNFTVKASNTEDFPNLTGINEEDEEAVSAIIHNDAVYVDGDTAYYTLHTATAGSSGVITYSQEAFDAMDTDTILGFSSSICPIGWRLPSLANLNYIKALYPGQSMPFEMPGKVYLSYNGLQPYSTFGSIYTSSYGAQVRYGDQKTAVYYSFVNGVLGSGGLFNTIYGFPIAYSAQFIMPIRCISGTSVPPSEYNVYSDPEGR